LTAAREQYNIEAIRWGSPLPGPVIYA
jgi:hypothetical protein